MDRAECTIEPFELKLQRNFSQQYFSTYRIRLQTQYPMLQAKIKSNYADIPIRNISDIIPKEKCVIIGTIYKEMKKKPSVLKVLSDNCHLSSLISNMREETNFVDESDKIFLEDFNQRIEVISHIEKLQTDKIITGVTVGLIGCCEDDDRGQFSVNDAIYPGPLEIKNSSVMTDEISNKARYILLVSGLNLGDEKGDKLSEVGIRLLSEWLSGKMGDLSSIIDVNYKDVGRVFILGDSVRVSSQVQESYVMSKFMPPKNQQQPNGTPTVDQSTCLITRLDSLLAQSLCPFIPVELMASSRLGRDASVFCSPLLPQPDAASMALFPLSLDWQSFHTRSSPLHFRDVRTHKTISMVTGETILDIARFTSPTVSTLEHMEALLRYGHLAPTCPDTLPASPLVSVATDNTPLDPLVLPWLPDMFVAGNQPEFAHKTLQFSHTDNHCLCVSVPVFSETMQCVLVDVESMTSVKLISLKGLQES